MSIQAGRHGNLSMKNDQLTMIEKRGDENVPN
jgi:hypothetical protein